jgi:hypothetical protein
MNTLEDFLLKAITYGVFSPPFFFSMIPLCFPLKMISDSFDFYPKCTAVIKN